MELIENAKRVIEVRAKNQARLQETLTILLGGLQLSGEEQKALESPKFGSAEDLRRAEDVIEKVGKFLKFQVDKFHNMKLYQNQVDFMEDKLIAFTTAVTTPRSNAYLPACLLTLPRSSKKIS